LEILKETRLMNSKSVDTPIDPNAKLLHSQGSLFQILKSIED